MVNWNSCSNCGGTSNVEIRAGNGCGCSNNGTVTISGGNCCCHCDGSAVVTVSNSGCGNTDTCGCNNTSWSTGGMRSTGTAWTSQRCRGTRPCGCGD